MDCAWKHDTEKNKSTKQLLNWKLSWKWSSCINLQYKFSGPSENIVTSHCSNLLWFSCFDSNLAYRGRKQKLSPSNWIRILFLLCLLWSQIQQGRKTPYKLKYKLFIVKTGEHITVSNQGADFNMFFSIAISVWTWSQKYGKHCYTDNPHQANGVTRTRIWKGGVTSASERSTGMSAPIYSHLSSWLLRGNKRVMHQLSVNFCFILCLSNCWIKYTFWLSSQRIGRLPLENPSRHFHFNVINESYPLCKHGPHCLNTHMAAES